MVGASAEDSSTEEELQRLKEKLASQQQDESSTESDDSTIESSDESDPSHSESSSSSSLSSSSSDSYSPNGGGSAKLPAINKPRQGEDGPHTSSTRSSVVAADALSKDLELLNEIFVEEAKTSPKGSCALSPLGEDTIPSKSDDTKPSSSISRKPVATTVTTSKSIQKTTNDEDDFFPFFDDDSQESKTDNTRVKRDLLASSNKAEDTPEIKGVSNESPFFDNSSRCNGSNICAQDQNLTSANKATEKDENKNCRIADVRNKYTKSESKKNKSYESHDKNQIVDTSKKVTTGGEPFHSRSILTEETKTLTDNKLLQIPRDDHNTSTKEVDINNLMDATEGSEPEAGTESFCEIHHSLYSPPPYQSKPQPLIHRFSLCNRPMHSRRKIPVCQIYEAPVSLIWKNKFANFNQLQSEIASALADSDDNIVVSAPTGAGKTVVFEMAMARLFLNDLRRGRAQNNMVSKSHKIVYVSPSKALCEERYNDWSLRLRKTNMGIEVAMITGDAEPGENFRDLASSHVILTTPEKWDVLTRRWTENFFLFASVKLFMVDEVHLLGDSSRGHCLESIVCRMKSIQRGARNIKASIADIQKSSYSNTSPEVIASQMRIVAVSATLPNVSDIAVFIDANETFTFDESYRPVPLTKHVIGLGYVGKNEYRFWNSLDRHIPELIVRFSKQRPTIVFCHSKPDTEKLTELLCTARGIGHSQGAVKSDIAYKTRTIKLQRCLVHGIAFHHAGLELTDRQLVESAFANGKIKVLCATSTLAMGVNLPAHLVMIKGTMAWRGGGCGYQEIDAGTMLQMIGRAGRPGFDTSGTAVILTDNLSKKRIEKLSNGLDLVESHLQNHLVDIMNSEISQRVITNSESALNWIKGTLFFVRLKKTPDTFGVNISSEYSVDSYLLNLCEKSIGQLQEIQAVTKNDSNGLSPTEAGHIMSKNIVCFEAMKILVGLPFDATHCQLLTALSNMEGLHRIVRKKEKKLLNDAHKMIKFKLEGPPSKVRVQTESEKAFVLLQAAIGQHFLEDFTLRQEMNVMVEYSSRMLSAAQAYSINGSMHGHVAAHCFKLRRSLAHSLWSPHDGVLNQLPGVGQTTTANLRFNGISTFADVLSSSDEEIQKAAKRVYPFGSQLRKTVSRILRNTLRLSASIEETSASPPTFAGIICNLTRCNEIPNLPREWGPTESKETTPLMYTLVAYTDEPGGCLFFKDDIVGPEELKFKCPPTFGRVVVQLMASMVGFDEKIELEGNKEIEKSSFAMTNRKKKSIHNTRIRDATRTLKPTVLTQLQNIVENVDDPRIQRRDFPKRRFDEERESTSTKGPGSGNSKRVRATDLPRAPPSTLHAKAIPEETGGLNRTAQHVAESREMPIKTNAEGEEGQQKMPAQSKINTAWCNYAVSPRSHFKSTNSTNYPVSGQWQGRNTSNESRANSIHIDLTGDSSKKVTNTTYGVQKEDKPLTSKDSITSQHSVLMQRKDKSNRPTVTPSPRPSASTRLNNSIPKPLQKTNMQSPRQPSSIRQVNLNADRENRPSPNFGRNIASQEATPYTLSQRKTSSKTSWKHEKRVQQKSQVRAFVRKKDNPFSQYKHDPNDAESYLDGLTVKNNSPDPSNIIPSQELQSLHQVSLSQRCQRARARMAAQQKCMRGRGRNRRNFNLNPRVTDRELLAMKAAEQEAYAATSPMPPMPWSQPSPLDGHHVLSHPQTKVNIRSPLSCIHSRPLEACGCCGKGQQVSASTEVRRRIAAQTGPISHGEWRRAPYSAGSALRPSAPYSQTMNELPSEFEFDQALAPFSSVENQVEMGDAAPFSNHDIHPSRDAPLSPQQFNAYIDQCQQPNRYIDDSQHQQHFQAVPHTQEQLDAYMDQSEQPYTNLDQSQHQTFQAGPHSQERFDGYTYMNPSQQQVAPPSFMTQTSLGGPRHPVEANQVFHPSKINTANISTQQLQYDKIFSVDNDFDGTFF